MSSEAMAKVKKPCDSSQHLTISPASFAGELSAMDFRALLALIPVTSHKKFKNKT